MLLDYGFNLLNLKNIMMGMFSFNERALACYRRVGFKGIGRRRQARIIGGKKYDLVLMDMLADEWLGDKAEHAVPTRASEGG
jgi:RimJ/RimL family protein N-acetyltransferase